VDTEAVMAKNIQISLASKVQESSTQFRKKQSAYLRKLGGNERASTPSFLDDTSAPDYDVSISKNALRQQQQSQTRTNDAAIVQREREIEDIAKGILELSDIFKELQTMVIDQGTMLDRIDYNVEMTRERVKGAEVDLGQVCAKRKHVTDPRHQHIKSEHGSGCLCCCYSSSYYY
jgi:syntaxin 16